MNVPEDQCVGFLDLFFEDGGDGEGRAGVVCCCRSTRDTAEARAAW